MNCARREEWRMRSGDIRPSAFWDGMEDFWSLLVLKTRRNTVAIDDRVLRNTKNAESEISGLKMNYGTNP